MLAHVDHLVEDVMHFCRSHPDGLAVEMERLMVEHHPAGEART